MPIKTLVTHLMPMWSACTFKIWDILEALGHLMITWQGSWALGIFLTLFCVLPISCAVCFNNVFSDMLHHTEKQWNHSVFLGPKPHPLWKIICLALLIITDVYYCPGMLTCTLECHLELALWRRKHQGCSVSFCSLTHKDTIRKQ